MPTCTRSVFNYGYRFSSAGSRRTVHQIIEKIEEKCPNGKMGEGLVQILSHIFKSGCLGD